MRNRPYLCMFLLISIIELSITGHSYGQREIILTRGITVKEPGLQYRNNTCDYELLIPGDRAGKQQVLEYNYSISPDNLIKAPEKEILANWKQISFWALAKTPIEVNIKLKIYTYDLGTAKMKPVPDANDEDTLQYLKAEANFQVNSKKIQTAAVGISGLGREEMVHGIFDFVVSKLDYKIFEDQDRGAKKALNEGEGDCTEYAELMVTLCRARNIPSRIVHGITLKANGVLGYHNWVEVYFPSYGWVAFDPTWADHPNSTTTFFSMKNVYIQMSNRRYIKNIFCSCKRSEYDFSYKLKDSYSDFDPHEEEKALSKKMYQFYNSNQPQKALELLDTLLSRKNNLYDYNGAKGVVCARLGKFDKGLECLQTSMKNAGSDYEKSLSFYAFSNYFAIKGDKDYAVMYLKKAITLGFKNYNFIMKDEDLQSIRDYPPFIELANELKLKQ